MRLGLRLGQASQAFLHHYHNQPQPTVVYLKHVKWITGKLQLEEHFRQYGEIREIYQFFDPNTGFHRGFASITFASRDAADKAKLAGDHYIDGGKVVVQSDQPMNQMKHTQFSQAASNNYKVIKIRANPKMANIGPKNMSISSQQPTRQPKQIEATTKSATAATPGPANSGAVLPPSAKGAGDDSGGSKEITKQQQMDATVKKGSFEH